MRRGAGGDDVAHDAGGGLVAVHRRQEVEEVVHLHKHVVVSLEDEGGLLLALLHHPLVAHHVLVGQVPRPRVLEVSLHDVAVEVTLQPQQPRHGLGLVAVTLELSRLEEPVPVEGSRLDGVDAVSGLHLALAGAGGGPGVAPREEQQPDVAASDAGDAAPGLADELPLLEVRGRGVDQHQQVELLRADRGRPRARQEGEVREVEQPRAGAGVWAGGVGAAVAGPDPGHRRQGDQGGGEQHGSSSGHVCWGRPGHHLHPALH